MAHSHHKIISEIFAYISSVGLVQQPDKAQAALRLSLFIVKLQRLGDIQGKPNLINQEFCASKSNYKVNLLTL